ncbi:U4/U6 small nuclear ribonucleoprotein PRP31, partial [Phenoliferia sp. Uapishka_3]
MASNSLADELLNDLENDSDDDIAQEQQQAGPSNGGAGDGSDEDEAMDDITDEMVLPSGGIRPAEELDPEAVNEMELASVPEVGKVAKLARGKQMRDVLTKIDYYRENPDANLASDGDSQEYQLIVQANNLSVEIDNEMLIVHKFIRDHYITRFPELDSLVSAPLAFCKVILALGNEGDLRGDLAGILNSGAVMAVTVTAATSKGEPLQPRAWDVVEGACEMMFTLDDSKRKILDYVESRISLLAPNISAIVGTQTATKILGIAGGLPGLNRIPASNIYLLGAIKKLNTGFSTASHSIDRLHTGFIYQCPMVQSTRPEDRMKAQRKIGAKVALAARVDIAGSSPEGAFGEEMVDKLEREMDRLARPSLKKVVKALPRPEEKVGKASRRGGRRARKLKEQFQQTELGKLQNRMKFGEAEEETGAYDETMGLGMIGSSSGKVRATTAGANNVKLNKAQKGKLAAFKSSSNGLATSGLASSLSFTPVQGLELIDPSKLRTKVDDANSRWFASGAFTHVPKEKGIGKPSAS